MISRIQILDIFKGIGIISGAVAGVFGLYSIFSPYIECPRYDLTGVWRVQTHVQYVGQERHKQEDRKNNIYIATISQSCKAISGSATKTAYGGHDVTRRERSYLEVKSTRISGDEIFLEFREKWQGSDAESNGAMTLTYNEERDVLSGTFVTAIGQISGSVEVAKLK